MLDITSGDSGVLVPRVPLVAVGNTTTPINAPATGLLVWNTNAGVTGGNGVGFYFFNGANWIPIQQTISDDADFYEVGGSSAPDAISDNMYTQGFVGIGWNNPAYPLEIRSGTNIRALSLLTSATAGNVSGIYNEVSGVIANGTDIQRGLFNLMSGTGGNPQYGVTNNFTSTAASTSYGFFNQFSNNSNADKYGVFNDIDSESTGGSLRVGLNNDILTGGASNNYGARTLLSGSSTGDQYGYHSDNSNTGGGDHYGTYSELDGSGSGDKYGSYNLIDASAGGTHYGIFSSALSGSGFAGYFLGRLSIGTSAADNYILPASRGTADQIMQTDATGNVSWVDNKPVSTINLYSNATYDMMHGTGGIDLIPMDAGFEPSIYEPTGRVQVKLVIRYYQAIGTNNFQLRAHNGTTETFPITNASGWTFATTQSGGVATSDWVDWNAGTDAHQIHLFGWNGSNNAASDRIFIRNAYLLVRSQ